jgi:histidine triad (HIT) family protein
MSTVFGQIIAGKLPCTKVFENEHIIAFKDHAPVAPVHILIVPKKEISDLQSLQPEDYPLMMEVVRVAQLLAKEFDITDGYRLITNNGSNAGQVVFHLHFHLIGGRKLGKLG